MKKIKVHTKDWCPYCASVRNDFADLNTTFVKIDVTADTALEQERVQRAKRTSVPQVFIGGLDIGGSDEFATVIDSGRFLGAEMIGPRAEHLANLLAMSHQSQHAIEAMLKIPFYQPVVEEGLCAALRIPNHELKQRQLIAA